MNGKILVTHGATTTHHIRDPNIVKTKGNPGKVASHIQKERWCSWCKRVGHTIWKCPQATIPHTSNHGDMVCEIHYALPIKLLLFICNYIYN